MSSDEVVEYSANPKMFRMAPVGFLLVLVLCVAVIGIPILIIWWLRCKNATLTITNKRVTLRTGILSKRTIELRHNHIRSVVVNQSLMNRIMGVGEIAVASAASGAAEIQIPGMVNPNQIKSIIQRYQS